MNQNKQYQRHYEESIIVRTNPETLFDFIDDHRKLSSHMGGSSMMMGGSKMRTEIDEGQGKKLGSHIQMKGNVFGYNLFLDEVITDRQPPIHKSWATVGQPKLLVINHYQMSVFIKPHEQGSKLTISIDYDLPKTNRWLGVLFGNYYANWCIKQMLKSVEVNFSVNK